MSQYDIPRMMKSLPANLVLVFGLVSLIVLLDRRPITGGHSLKMSTRQSGSEPFTNFKTSQTVIAYGTNQAIQWIRYHVNQWLNAGYHFHHCPQGVVLKDL